MINDPKIGEWYCYALPGGGICGYRGKLIGFDEGYLVLKLNYCSQDKASCNANIRYDRFPPERVFPTTLDGIKWREEQKDKNELPTTTR